MQKSKRKRKAGAKAGDAKASNGKSGRTKYLMVRLRPDEKELYQQAADAEDADSLSNWVRGLIKQRLAERAQVAA